MKSATCLKAALGEPAAGYALPAMGGGPADLLSATALALIENPANRLRFSVASLWEVAIKRALDRPDPGTLRAGLLSAGYAELTIEGRHVLILSALPPLHRDPFDRLLLAQATALLPMGGGVAGLGWPAATPS